MVTKKGMEYFKKINILINRMKNESGVQAYPNSRGYIYILRGAQELQAYIRGGFIVH
jgi:hypothetical protein